MSVVEPAGVEGQRPEGSSGDLPREPVAGTVVEEARGADVRDKDIKELLKDLGDGVTTLLKQEIEFIKAELAQKTDVIKEELQDTVTQAKLEIDVAKEELKEEGKKAGIGAGLFGTAGLLGFGAFATFTACLVALFALVMPVWVSAFLVTLLYAAVAAGLAFAGRKQVKEVELPIPKTVKRLGEVLTSGKERVQQEVAPIPQEVVEPLKAAKEEAQQAWQRGGEKP